jgi:hypothetical protein
LIEGGRPKSQEPLSHPAVNNTKAGAGERADSAISSTLESSDVCGQCCHLVLCSPLSAKMRHLDHSHVFSPIRPPARHRRPGSLGCRKSPDRRVGIIDHVRRMRANEPLHAKDLNNRSVFLDRKSSFGVSCRAGSNLLPFAKYMANYIRMSDIDQYLILRRHTLAAILQAQSMI